MTQFVFSVNATRLNLSVLCMYVHACSGIVKMYKIEEYEATVHCVFVFTALIIHIRSLRIQS